MDDTPSLWEEQDSDEFEPGMSGELVTVANLNSHREYFGMNVLQWTFSFTLARFRTDIFVSLPDSYRSAMFFFFSARMLKILISAYPNAVRAADDDGHETGVRKNGCLVIWGIDLRVLTPLVYDSTSFYSRIIDSF